MNEIVKYENQMNTVALRKFKPIEIDLLMTICSRMREKGLNEIEFHFDKLKSLVNHKRTDKKELALAIKSTYDKLISLDFKIETKDVWIKFVLFTMYKVDVKNETVLIKINQDFKYILNELTSNFTRFELSEFVSIKSSYAKELYRRLKQYRLKGIYNVDIDEFKRLLDIPSGYKMDAIDKRVLKPCIDELKPYFKGLKIEKIKGKYNKVKRLIFTFKVEKIDISSYIEKEKLDYKYNSKKPKIEMDYTDDETEFNFDEVKKK